jgi:16S rRNA (guanine527-N7)-methyltransferase
MFHVKHDGSTQTPPPAAADIFGDRLEMAGRYVELLATAGVERGLIGPREADRLWQRHVLNSAAVAELIPEGARVADIGSGAGLPGIPLALARPDLRIVLIEPLLRRAAFLSEVVDILALDGVTVARGRAEDVAIKQDFGDQGVATSRAVASLDKLTRWSVPLLSADGRMLALKGERAAAEVAEQRGAMTSLGVSDIQVVECGVSYLNPPTTVVVAQRAAHQTRRGRRR